MFPIPYVLYQMAFRNHIGPKTALELATSTKYIRLELPTRLGPVLYSGLESEYLLYLLDTELLHYSITQIAATPTTPTTPKAQDVLTFIRRHSLDRVGWFKALFRLFYD